ncbi:hypothetical protein FA95DRAFT_1507036 [Auriscalpium vulgare]|uniref:Uncharacterized protein n=1 Tax=Auriscalpium vulgare TaxID=40419 RepID=A0ACB8QZU6_9AGAM|nr:hypothetical protein FA95DRAFT_1507036 [Auriscalpium vulgare]
MPGNSLCASQTIGRGTHPELRKNGLNPVVSEQAEFIANSMIGSLSAQSF